MAALLEPYWRWAFKVIRAVWRLRWQPRGLPVALIVVGAVVFYAVAFTLLW
jgi:hypothetical protein